MPKPASTAPIAADDAPPPDPTPPSLAIPPVVVDGVTLEPAPDATRCDAGGGTCGAGQPLYTVNGLYFCFSHAAWPASKEGRIATAIALIEKGG